MHTAIAHRRGGNISATSRHSVLETARHH